MWFQHFFKSRTSNSTRRRPRRSPATGRLHLEPLEDRRLLAFSTPVDYGTLLGIEPDLAKMVEPVVDFTPSAALSSFVIYDGKAFPRWRGNLLVGSLKATELYRVVPEGDRATRVETLVRGLGRIRDVATANDGTIYVLLEHVSGGRIVRLLPA